MPVQINEMVIRAHIEENQDKKGSPAADTGGQLPDKEAFIRECTDMILEILNRKNER